MKEVIQIAIPLALTNCFSYYAPRGVDADSIIGKRVLIDFRGRKIKGYAVSKGTYSGSYKIKAILKIIDEEPIFTGKMVTFAAWLADYYFAGIGEVLSLMVPKAVRPKYFSPTEPENTPARLSDEQQEVYNRIKTEIAAGKKRFYLYGVTGSGKTEIYMELIEKTINEGKSVIFLVPEIALSLQTLERLQKRFGKLCALLHSGLSASYRLGEYLRLKNGEAKIAIGPRSALFAPLEHIGLIIIDEENEGAYKSEENPRFHARTCAFYWAQKNDALVLLGSATPSIESWYYARKGFMSLFALTKRYGGAQLPSLKTVDTSRLQSSKSISSELSAEINRRLQDKEQIILLQNRRGFSNYLICSSCNTIVTCPRCSISLTYHKTDGRLVCHRCGYKIYTPESCPECGETKLKTVGAGTQRIEEEITGIFPHARVLRIDYDTIKNKAEIKEIFKTIEKGEIDIIVGTQMIAKGLHFPGIKFVGIINADLTLNMPDYKAPERTFSLITQVAGRSGREGKAGCVLIQTLNPGHYALQTALSGNFPAFFEQEIEFRSILEMPPFYRLIRLVIRGKDEQKVQDNCEQIYTFLSKHESEACQISGTSPCMIGKINKNYRYQILLKSKKIDSIQGVIKKEKPNFNLSRGNYLEIDVDPVDLF